MPRRSTATIGWAFSTSPPERASHCGSCTDVGMSEPVVSTSGPASAGVPTALARTTPIDTVPEAPLIVSRSASKVAHSRVTPGTAGTVASPKICEVHSLHASSFLGAAICAGPVGVSVVGVGPDPPECPESEA